MEVCRSLVAVRSSRVRLLRIQRLCLEPTDGELQPNARSSEQQFFFQFNNLYDYSVYRHNDYRYNRDYYYRHNDYRDYNNYSVIVSSRGKQCRQPAAGELHSDARSLHHSNNNFHNDYRYNRDYYYRHNDYRDYNNYSVIVSSRGKQCRQPAAGELQSDARSLQHSNNNFHNDYRDYWHNHNYSNSNSCRYYRPDCR